MNSIVEQSLSGRYTIEAFPGGIPVIFGKNLIRAANRNIIGGPELDLLFGGLDVVKFNLRVRTELRLPPSNSPPIATQHLLFSGDFLAVYSFERTP